MIFEKYLIYQRNQGKNYLPLMDWLDTPMISVYNLAAVKIPR